MRIVSASFYRGTAMFFTAHLRTRLRREGLRSRVCDRCRRETYVFACARSPTGCWTAISDPTDFSHVPTVLHRYLAFVCIRVEQVYRQLLGPIHTSWVDVNTCTYSTCMYMYALEMVWRLCMMMTCICKSDMRPSHQLLAEAKGPHVPTYSRSQSEVEF